MKNLQKNNPLFITFEGGEGAGKTTLIRSLETRLLEKGLEVVKTREPGGTPLGEEVRQLLLHQEKLHISSMSELMLFLTSRAQQIHETLKPALEKGQVVLCDRFNESSIAYQGAARGLGMDLVDQICRLVCQGLEPDFTFILSLDPKLGMKRIQNRSNSKDRMEKQKEAFHYKVYEAYQWLANKYPQRVFLIDAGLPKEEVFNQVWNLLGSKINL